jgi:hypothetical protein
MLTVGTTLLGGASCGELPRIARANSFVRSVHHDVVVCAACAVVAPAVSSWIVVATPGLT